MNYPTDAFISMPGQSTLRLRAGAVQDAVGQSLKGPSLDFSTTSIFDIVAAHAMSAAADPAIVDSDWVVTYGQLVMRVRQIRSQLTTHGCASGDRIAVVGPRGIATVAALLAIESIGGCYLPLSADWPTEYLSTVLRESRPKCILTHSGDAVDAADMALLKIQVASPAGEDSPGSVPPPSRRAPDEARYVLYTSGSTGKPKGAVVEHQGMVNHLWSKIRQLRLTATDAVAFSAPTTFVISVWQMLAPLLVGGQVTVLDDIDMRYPRRLVSALRTGNVTVVELTPTMIGHVIDDLSRHSQVEGLPRLRCLLSTGEELNPRLAGQALSRLSGVELVNAYGMTECSDDVTHQLIAPQDLGQHRVAVGVPIANTALYLLVDEDGAWRAAGPGETGELFVGGMAVGNGYLDPARTQAAFFLDPFDPESPTGRLYRTGDLARFENGRVYYLGRADRQVKVAGIRIEPSAVEAAILAHPQVERCAVTVRQERGNPALVAVYVAARPIDPLELREFLRSSFPASFIPRRWVQVESIPLGPNGKIDHRALLRDNFVENLPQ